MKKILCLLFIVLFSSCLSCKSDEKRKNKFHKITDFVVLHDSQKKVAEKGKIIVFYEYLFQEKSVTIEEFNLLFGDVYMAAERYFRFEYGHDRSSFEDFKFCIKNPSECKSVLFLEILRRKETFTFECKFDLIKSIIEKSKLIGDTIVLSFPEGGSISFHFNKYKNFESILLNDGTDFLNIFQE